MDVIVVGINHNNSPIQVREKVSFSKTDLDIAYSRLKEYDEILESVIISTCNRSEIVSYVTKVDDGIKRLKSFYSDFFNIPMETMEEYFFIEESDSAVKHVYKLAVGLDSLILGEDQIIGQVRSSHMYALEKGATGSVLNTLFRECITTAKKIKRETLISQNSLSISSIAVKFIENRFHDLKDKKVLVIGVGEMSRIAIENLIYKGVSEIYVTNRTVGHAIDLSNRYKEIKVVEFKNRYDLIKEVDIIISSTSAPHYVLKKEHMEKYHNKEKELCIVDIALPRDVEPEINNMEKIHVYELDELKKVALDNMEMRMEAAKNAMEIIIEEAVKFQNWYNCLSVFPVIDNLKKTTKEILDEEIDSLICRLDGATDKDKALIKIVMNSLVKKIIKKPIHNLKMAGEDKQGELYAKVTNELFSMKEYSCKGKGESYE
ncbi:MAG: glutamyl-tRNA reductase [Anaeromicrobium sp.]|uniref:glutamyl-tRNA reductase n=1 Tax=Anaeromicrobium sp. TaxID=1929132 RepID=UPI0025E6A4A8|nr:glutamyl-tRNA reductase [Anaeromicrobium sp.]MCT4593249.1 glutamyl-tRNA reductase [Anaeromicrobium sp.]